MRSTCIEKDVVPKLKKKCSSEIETNNSSSLVGSKRLNTVEADMCSERRITFILVSARSLQVCKESREWQSIHVERGETEILARQGV